MFCHKCGQKNPENGKFCRSCGTDLGNTSVANSENVPAVLDDLSLEELGSNVRGRRAVTRSKDPAEVYGSAIRNIISGIGFLAVSMALLLTNVANGKTWWWAMLFPAFSLLARGVADLMKSKKMEAHQTAQFSSAAPTASLHGSDRSALPPQSTPFFSPESKYKTGDLVPPSVTDHTTRHLEIDKEGRTMTLPKK